MEALVNICQIILLICFLNNVKPSAAAPVDDGCQVGQYRCTGPALQCIKLNLLCNGKADCPNGDDEESSYCIESIGEHYLRNYNPGKAYLNEGDRYNRPAQEYVQGHLNYDETEEKPIWEYLHCSAGQYQCSGTLDVCISLENFCDGHQDCPHNDDESLAKCKDRNKPKPAQQPVKYDGKSIEREEEEWADKYKNLNGLAFQVENLLIYNSDVKMFNQNSDNNNVNTTKV